MTENIRGLDIIYFILNANTYFTLPVPLQKFYCYVFKQFPNKKWFNLLYYKFNVLFFALRYDKTMKTLMTPDVLFKPLLIFI